MAGAELDVKIEERGDVTVITLVGPIDSATFDHFKAMVSSYTRAAPARVLIDCRQLTYINSKGIGLLANWHRKAMIKMGGIVLVGLSPRITKTLELLGLGKRLRICEDEAEALAMLNPPAGDKLEE